jgi:hypothetical protein
MQLVHNNNSGAREGCWVVVESELLIPSFPTRAVFASWLDETHGDLGRQTRVGHQKRTIGPQALT